MKTQELEKIILAKELRLLKTELEVKQKEQGLLSQRVGELEEALEQTKKQNEELRRNVVEPGN